ncbi:MAG TPA: hypothetical protein VGN15_12605 [Ktedonobacteraceae bacterium]|jgi:hypothetical protein|nr:hypothetical protein [Ktedonobacteraceae bacterium]
MKRLDIPEIDAIVGEAKGWNDVMGQESEVYRDAVIAENQTLIIRLLADIAKGIL